VEINKDLWEISDGKYTCLLIINVQRIWKTELVYFDNATKLCKWYNLKTRTGRSWEDFWTSRVLVGSLIWEYLLKQIWKLSCKLIEPVDTGLKSTIESKKKSKDYSSEKGTRVMTSHFGDPREMSSTSGLHLRLLGTTSECISHKRIGTRAYGSPTQRPSTLFLCGSQSKTDYPQEITSKHGTLGNKSPAHSAAMLKKHGITSSSHAITPPKFGEPLRSGSCPTTTLVTGTVSFLCSAIQICQRIFSFCFGMSSKPLFTTYGEKEMPDDTEKSAHHQTGS